MWREWLQLPTGTLELIIEYRLYAAAYRAYRQDPKVKGDMVTLVKEIEFGFAQEAMDAEHVCD